MCMRCLVLIGSTSLVLDCLNAHSHLKVNYILRVSCTNFNISILRNI